MIGIVIGGVAAIIEIKDITIIATNILNKIDSGIVFLETNVPIGYDWLHTNILDVYVSAYLLIFVIIVFLLYAKVVNYLKI